MKVTFKPLPHTDKTTQWIQSFIFTPLQRKVCYCGSWLMMNGGMLEDLLVTRASSSLQHVLWSDSGDANRKHTLLCLCVCGCRWSKVLDFFSNTSHVRLHVSCFQMLINRLWLVRFFLNENVLSCSLPQNKFFFPPLGIIKMLNWTRLFYLASEIIRPFFFATFSTATYPDMNMIKVCLISL